MDPAWGRALVDLLLTAAVGRVVLSLLPPGPLGRHERRELPATWAASHVLGLAGLAYGGLIADSARALGFTGGEAWRLGPFALLAVLRIATLPGALVPRHEVAGEPAGPAARALQVAVVLASLGVGLRTACGMFLPNPFDLLPRAAAAGALPAAANVLGAAILLARALAIARRAPAARWGAVLALLLLIYVAPPRRLGAGTELVLGWSAALAGSVAWLRRADRRELALAGLAVAALVPLDGAAHPLAVLATVALASATARPSRRAALLWGFVPAALLLASLYLPWIEPARMRLQASFRLSLLLPLTALAPAGVFGAHALALAAAAAGTALVLRARRADLALPHRERPELGWAAAAAGLVALLAAMPAPLRDPAFALLGEEHIEAARALAREHIAERATLLLAVGATLLLGLALGRRERELP